MGARGGSGAPPKAWQLAQACSLAWAGAPAWQRRQAGVSAFQVWGAWQAVQRWWPGRRCSPPRAISLWQLVQATIPWPGAACGLWQAAQAISMVPP
jgi:hypothetical protein